MPHAKYTHWDEYDIKPGTGKGCSLTRFEYEWPMLHKHYVEVLGRDTGRSSHDDGWTGGSTTTMEKLLVEGDRKGVEEAERLLDQINTQIDVEDLGLRMDMAPMGGSVSIGHYLAGQPACMRKMVETDSERSPIRVFVGLACSAANSVEVQRKRGIACVALTMALSRIRPVELWGYCATKPTAYCVEREHQQRSIDTCIMVKVGMSPFDMSVVSALMTQLVLTRDLMYAMSEHYAGDKTSHCIHWPEHTEKECCGATELDVFVPQARYDQAEKIWTDPVAWVQEQLQLALKNHGEAMRLGYGSETEYRDA